MPPRGREEVTRALLTAAAELFASRGFDGVSVRDIAAEAGVNHGLVHRHFGSKHRLYREVIDNLTQQLADAAAGGVTRETLRAPAMDTYWRMLARGLLDGVPMRRLQRSFPVARMFLAELGRARDGGVLRADVDLRLLAALGITAGLGWLLFRPFVVAALDLDDGPELEARLVGTWLALAGG